MTVNNYYKLHSKSAQLFKKTLNTFFGSIIIITRRLVHELQTLQIYCLSCMSSPESLIFQLLIFIVSKKCFSCWQSLWERQGKKFSHTEWRARNHPVFFFLPWEETVFWPTQPLFFFCQSADHHTLCSGVGKKTKQGKKTLSAFLLEGALYFFKIHIVSELWGCILVRQTHDIQCVRFVTGLKINHNIK